MKYEAKREEHPNEEFRERTEKLINDRTERIEIEIENLRRDETRTNE